VSKFVKTVGCSTEDGKKKPCGQYTIDIARLKRIIATYNRMRRKGDKI